MKKKLVVFFDMLVKHNDRVYSNIYKANNRKLDIERFTPDSSLECISLDYVLKNKDHRAYGKVIDYCIRYEVDYLFMPLFSNPEFLYAELLNKKLGKLKISIATTFSWWHKYGPRANIFKKILNHSNILNVFILTIDADNMVYPPYAKFLEKNKKAVPIYEYTLECTHEYTSNISKKEFGFSKDDCCILYFGSMYHGKGLDILYNSFKFLETDVKFIISSNKDSLNFDFNYSPLYIKKNILFLDEFVSHETKMKLFGICDAVVFPYRKTYEHASSQVFIQSMMAEKPVIAPDFYPFNEAVSKDSLGLLFKPEDPENLALTIDCFYKLKKGIHPDFYRYKMRMHSWEEILKMVTRK